MEWYAQPYIDFYWGHWWDEYNQFYGFRIGKVNAGIMIWRAREDFPKNDSR